MDFSTIVPGIVRTAWNLGLVQKVGKAAKGAFAKSVHSAVRNTLETHEQPEQAMDELYSAVFDGTPSECQSIAAEETKSSTNGRVWNGEALAEQQDRTLKNMSQQSQAMHNIAIVVRLHGTDIVLDQMLDEKSNWSRVKSWAQRQFKGLCYSPERDEVSTTATIDTVEATYTGEVLRQAWEGRQEFLEAANAIQEKYGAFFKAREDDFRTGEHGDLMRDRRLGDVQEAEDAEWLEVRKHLSNEQIQATLKKGLKNQAKEEQQLTS